VAPFTGTFRPQSPLSALNGKRARGTWGLHVIDSVVGGTGDITDFELELGLGPVPNLDVHQGSAGGPAISAGQAATGAFAFGDQRLSAGPTAPVTVYIGNTGTAALTISTPSITGGGGAFTLTPPATTTIAKGASTTFTVRFAPSVAGTATATVSFTHNDTAATSPFTFGLSGRGTQPAISVVEGSVPLANASSINFGSQGVSAGATAKRTITINNPGNTTLTLGTPALSGANPSDFILDTTGFSTTVAAGGSTTLGISFDPSTVGARTATLSITHDAGGSPFVLNLSGTGVVSLGSGGGGGGGGGGGCSTGGRPDFATPIFGAAMILLLSYRRRARARIGSATAKTIRQ
jgi:hypothetical protein